MGLTRSSCTSMASDLPSELNFPKTTKSASRSEAMRSMVAWLKRAAGGKPLRSSSVVRASCVYTCWPTAERRSMVSSSRPSLSQSRRGLAPSFSNGNTRKMPCEEAARVGWTIVACCPAKTLPHRERARHKTKRTFTANVWDIRGIVTERESPPTRIEARRRDYGNVESAGLGARISCVSGSFSMAEKDGSVFKSFMEA